MVRATFQAEGIGVHRIWVPADIRAGENLRLESGEARRLRKVLRLGRGDRVRVFNDKRVEGEAEILELSTAMVLLLIRRVEVVDRESPLCVRLFQAIPKADRMAWAIQKATELGVREIGVITAQRCIQRLGPVKQEGRMTRWRRILHEAARQCGRTQTPSLTGPWELDAFCERASQSDAIKIVLWESEERLGLREALAYEHERPQEIWLAVGPEGGFETPEVQQLEGAGFRSVRMGPRILRTESAGPAALAILQYIYGDLG